MRVRLDRPKLEVAIARQNVSRKELAQDLSISRSLLSQVINGKKEPSAMVRRRLLEYFRNYTFDDLFTIEEDGHGR